MSPGSVGTISPSGRALVVHPHGAWPTLTPNMRARFYLVARHLSNLWERHNWTSRRTNSQEILKLDYRGRGGVLQSLGE